MEKELRIEFTRNPYIITIRYDGEVIWEHYFEHPVDFISSLHILESKNDKEIYDWCKNICYFTEMGTEEDNLKFKGVE